jgi:uncharacterized protein (DUF1778 family)
MGRRGPQPRPADENRGSLIAFRLRADDAQRLKDAAAKAGVSVSDYVRNVVMRAVRS